MSHLKTGERKGSCLIVFLFSSLYLAPKTLVICWFCNYNKNKVTNDINEVLKEWQKVMDISILDDFVDTLLFENDQVVIAADEDDSSLVIWRETWSNHLNKQKLAMTRSSIWIHYVLLNLFTQTVKQ